MLGMDGRANGDRDCVSATWATTRPDRQNAREGVQSANIHGVAKAGETDRLTLSNG